MNSLQKFLRFTDWPSVSEYTRANNYKQRRRNEPSMNNTDRTARHCRNQQAFLRAMARMADNQRGRAGAGKTKSSTERQTRCTLLR